MLNLLSKSKNISILILCSTLLACGGGGNGGGGNNNDSKLQTGVFLDSKVEGLHYKTATQSGLTNKAGEFSYQDGETVTFSVGGITLGSTLASSQITPFDLFDLTPPQNESEVLAILSNFREVDNYDRVFNIVVFLTSLDNDGNPENGIDLTGWHATLKDANLSFDKNKNYFQFDEFKEFTNLFSVNRVKNLPVAISHIINSLNIEILVNLVSKRKTDNGGDGSVNTIIVNEYDAQGRQTVSKSDRDNDGTFEHITNTQFNARGLIEQRESKSDFDDDGTVDLINTTNMTYDINDNLKTNIQNTDTDGNGDNDERISRTFTYDTNHNAIKIAEIRTEINKVLGEIIISRETTFFTFDEAGRKLTERAEVDNNGDFDTDTIRSNVFKFDTKGNKISEVSTNDFNADGTPEQTKTVTSTFDVNGNEVTRLREVDYTSGHDGVDDIQSTVFTYDSNGNVLTKITEFSDHFFDILSPHKKHFETTTYNEKGKQLTVLLEQDTDNDGTKDSSNLDEFEYDSDGNNIKLTYIENNDLLTADNSYKSVTTKTFNTSGKLLVHLFEEDSDGDGSFDSARKTTDTFNSTGNRLSSLEEIDDSADGNFETEQLRTFEYTPVSGGLLGLIMQNILS